MGSIAIVISMVTQRHLTEMLVVVDGVLGWTPQYEWVPVK